DGKIIITKNNLNKKINEIIQEYYEDIIKNIDIKNTDGVQKLFVRYLIEKKLIDIKTNGRICLDKASIYPLGINDDILTRLIESKLIRKEINTVSGESFEISHDSLVKPILRAARSKALGELESQLYDYYLKKIKSLDLVSKTEFRKILLPKLLDKEGNLKAFKLRDIAHEKGFAQLQPDRNKELQKAITASINEPIASVEILTTSDSLTESIKLFKSWNILEEIKTNNKRDNFFIINEAFRDAIIKKQNHDRVQRRKVMVNVIIAQLCLILVAFIYFDIKIRKQHTTDIAIVKLFSNVAAFNPPASAVNADTIVSVKKLRLLSGLYKSIKSADTEAVSHANTILIGFFNSYDFLGKRIFVKGLYPFLIRNNGRNRLLVLYKTRAGINQPDSPISAYLYDEKGNFLHEKFTNILDASFGRNSELVVLKSDSIIIDNNKAKLNFTDNIKLQNSSATIDSINSENVFIQIHPITSTKKVGGPSNKHRLLPVPVSLARINPEGDVTKVTLYRSLKQGIPLQTEIMSLGIGKNTIKTFKHITLSYPYLGKSLIKFIHGKPTKSINLDDPIVDVSFDEHGDTIFINNGPYLTILDTSLNKLSRFKQPTKNNGEIQKQPSFIAYIQSGYVVFVDFRDPIIKSVKTLQPESIINYIDRNKHMVFWPSLTDNEKKNFGF
ncbi:MAG: hypothetical protein ACTHJ8_09905, partial [Mucilaginibacter sp.]